MFKKMQSGRHYTILCPHSVLRNFPFLVWLKVNQLNDPNFVFPKQELIVTKHNITGLLLLPLNTYIVPLGCLEQFPRGIHGVEVSA